MGGRTAKGKAIVNILPIPVGVSIAAIMPVDVDESEWDNLQIVFATSAGDIRRNALSDFTNVRSNGKIAMDLNEGIELVNARIAGEEDDVMLFTDSGRAGGGGQPNLFLMYASSLPDWLLLPCRKPGNGRDFGSGEF